MMLSSLSQYNEVEQVEKETLGQALSGGSDVVDAINDLDSNDFMLERHQVIWRSIKYLYDHNKPVDVTSVMQQLVDSDDVDKVGGITYLTDLHGSVATTATASHYAERVKRYAYKRRVLEATEKVREIALTPGLGETEELADAIHEMVDSVEAKKDEGMKHISEYRERYFEHLRSKNEFLKTGFPKFDKWSGGLNRGDLYILAGRPSAGKTAKALQVASNIAMQKKGAVALFSQEMAAEQLISRLVASAVGIPHSRLFRRDDLTEANLKLIERAFDRMESLPLFIEDASGKSLSDVKAVGRKLKRKHGLATIVIDYLQIMRIPQRPQESRAQAIGNVTAGLKTLARELHVPIVLLAQLSRATEMKDRPQLSDLKESGDIEQDADVVEFLYRNEEDYKTYPLTSTEKEQFVKYTRSFIAKGRNIGVNEFLLKFHGMRQQLVEYREIGS